MAALICHLPFAANAARSLHLLMSAAAGSAAAGSASEERYVVVVGNCGVGKSTFINTHLPDGSRAQTGESARPVTEKTIFYLSDKPGYTLVDTVGINLRGYASGLPLSRLEGKLVHFVMLFNGLRWHPDYLEFQYKLEWAKIGSNSSRWAGHGAVFTKSERRADALDPVQLGKEGEPTVAPPLINMLKDLSVLTFERLPSKPQPLPPPPPSPPASTKMQLKAAASSAAPSNKSKELSKAEQWFNRKELSKEQSKLHDLWLSLQWPIPSQRAMTPAIWRLIQTRDEIEQYRQTGEALLVLHLYTMLGHKNHADNETLVDEVIDKVPGLRQHIEECYGHQHQHDQKLSEQTLADYIEALCHKLLLDSKGRRFIVDFLQEVTGLNAPR